MPMQVNTATCGYTATVSKGLCSSKLQVQGRESCLEHACS
jgi:hypothetical protein